MLRRNTVFIIGAGASKEYGLPVGGELAAAISDKLDIKFDRSGDHSSGDLDLFNNVRRMFPNDDLKLQQAAWTIRDGIVLASSIDDFLHVHQHDELIVAYGKAAIAKCILEAERGSSLFFDPTVGMAHELPALDFVSCSNTWLVQLMRMLGRGLPRTDREKIFDRCHFIIFNYDRCVEHFFETAIERFYSISASEAASITRKATMVHPYGTAGQLEASDLRSTEFGARSADYCKIGAESLKTYTEQVESERLKSLIRQAEQIVFLGFAYHDQNLRILADDGNLEHKRFIGTAVGMSTADIHTVEDQLGRWFHRPINRRETLESPIDIQHGLSAADVFFRYSKSL